MKRIIFLGSLFYSSLVFSQNRNWTLEESIEYAKVHNLQIISNEYALKTEEKNLKIAQNDYLPSISVSMNNHLRFGQTQGFQGSIGRNDNFNNGLTVSASLLLYNGGKLEKQIEKQKYDIAVARENVELIKNNISLEIIQRYLSILLNKEVLKINKTNVKNAQKLYNRAKITTEIGTTARTILAEAEASLAQEKQKLNLAEIDIKRSLFALAQLLQLKDYYNFDIEEIEMGENIPLFSYSLEEIIERVYSHHPQILSAKNSLKSAKAQTKIVKTNFLPTISLSAGVGTFYYNSLVTNITGVNALGNYIKEKTIFQQYITNFYQQIGVSVSIPIFNKGNTKLQIEKAKINEYIAKNNLAVQKQDILQKIQKVYFDMESYYQTLLSAIETEKSAKLALDFAEKSYEAGKTSIYDLNITRNNHASTKSSVIQAKYNYYYQIKILEFYFTGNIK